MTYQRIGLKSWGFSFQWKLVVMTWGFHNSSEVFGSRQGASQCMGLDSSHRDLPLLNLGIV